jgi:hypothetical protein
MDIMYLDIIHHYHSLLLSPSKQFHISIHDMYVCVCVCVCVYVYTYI